MVPKLTTITTTNKGVSSITDETLVKMVSQGDDKAFEILIKRYEKSVYNYLYRLLDQSVDSTEEVAQATFIQAYKSLKQFRSNGNFRAWLFGIAVNQARSYWRQSRRYQEKEYSVDASDENWLLEIPDPSPVSFDESMEIQSQLNTIHKALATLDTRYRSVLLLRYQQDLSYQEISDAMHVPLNTIRTWLRRGKVSLLNAINREGSTL